MEKCNQGLIRQRWREGVKEYGVEESAWNFISPKATLCAGTGSGGC